MAGSRWKARLFALIVILASSLGNFSITWGMRRIPTLVHSPLDAFYAIFTPWVAVGIVLLIAWVLARMIFLSFADLSYVLPVTSLGYVMGALMGHFFLGEVVTIQRWMGVGLIVAGTVLVGKSTSHTDKL